MKTGGIVFLFEKKSRSSIIALRLVQNHEILPCPYGAVVINKGTPRDGVSVAARTSVLAPGVKR